MTSVWVAEHGWCYPMAAIDRCTREIVGWQLELRCRAKEAIALIERAVVARGAPDTLTIGTDNGSAFTARAFRLVLCGPGIAHRRGGYRDPESQAFIQSWFAKLKERRVWLHEFKTLDQAPELIGAHITSYHHRPHSGLNDRTPAEVAQTWDDALADPQTHAARTVNRRGEQAKWRLTKPTISSSSGGTPAPLRRPDRPPSRRMIPRRPHRPGHRTPPRERASSGFPQQPPWNAAVALASAWLLVAAEAAITCAARATMRAWTKGPSAPTASKPGSRCS
jgi:hypothetical protein